MKFKTKVGDGIRTNQYRNEMGCPVCWSVLGWIGSKLQGWVLGTVLSHFIYRDGTGSNRNETGWNKRDELYQKIIILLVILIFWIMKIWMFVNLSFEIYNVIFLMIILKIFCSNLLIIFANWSLIKCYKISFWA